MAKVFETEESIVKMVEEQFSKTGLDRFTNLKVMSVAKQKDVVKVSKASAATEYLTKQSDIIQVFVYEEAMKNLDDESCLLLLEMAFSAVSYDSEKDKLNFDNNPFNSFFAMRKKYGDKIDNIVEASYLLIKQLSDKKKDEVIEQK